MSTDQYIQTAISDFEKALFHLNDEFSRLQIGRANPGLIEHLLVEVYGVQQPIKNMANISVPDPKTLQIQPWDRSALGSVEKAIQQSDLGLNPVNNGISILLNIPPLTEERRRDLAKIVYKLAEDARISIRNIRQVAHSKFKQMAQNKEITEDEVTGAEKRLQEKVDEYNGKVAEVAKQKEESIMKV